MMYRNAVLILLSELVLLGCTREDTSRRALEHLGFTGITLTSSAPLSCSESHEFSTGFVAKDHGGVETRGIVCCGTLTGEGVWNCTVRF